MDISQCQSGGRYCNNTYICSISYQKLLRLCRLHLPCCVMCQAEIAEDTLFQNYPCHHVIHTECAKQRFHAMKAFADCPRCNLPLRIPADWTTGDETWSFLYFTLHSIQVYRNCTLFPAQSNSDSPPIARYASANILRMAKSFSFLSRVISLDKKVTMSI